MLIYLVFIFYSSGHIFASEIKDFLFPDSVMSNAPHPISILSENKWDLNVTNDYISEIHFQRVRYIFERAIACEIWTNKFGSSGGDPPNVIEKGLP